MNITLTSFIVVKKFPYCLPHFFVEVYVSMQVRVQEHTLEAKEGTLSL